MVFVLLMVNSDAGGEAPECETRNALSLLFASMLLYEYTRMSLNASVLLEFARQFFQNYWFAELNVLLALFCNSFAKNKVLFRQLRPTTAYLNCLV